MSGAANRDLTPIPDEPELDELNDELFYVGPWLEHKRPRSVEARRHLLASLRQWRSWRAPGFVPPIPTTEFLRAHRELKRVLIATEESSRPLREKYFLWRAKSSGGVQ